MASIEELNILLERIRYHDDYRTKIFGFYVTLNGVLISFLQTLSDSKGSLVSLYLFAFVASLFGLMNSIRSTIIADKYRVAAVDLEKDLGFTHLYAVHNSIVEEIKGRKFVLRYSYTFFYVSMLFVWGVFTYWALSQKN